MGAATDAAMQLMDPDLKGFSWSRVLAAGVNGTIGGGAGYFQNRAISKSCFAAGTPLLVRGSGGALYSKRIEDIIAGDAVLSRDESDAGGVAGYRCVEEAFRRFAETVELRLEGGVRIGTTGEHPFFVADRLAAVGGGRLGNEWVSNRNGGATAVAEVERVAYGEWLPAWELRAGDALVGHDGRRVGVEGVRETGLWEPVYNLRVEEYHTYFVGCDGWGFSVWAHNEYRDLSVQKVTEMLEARGIDSHVAKSVAEEIGRYGGHGDSDTLARRAVQDVVEAGGGKAAVQEHLMAFVREQVASPASQSAREALAGRLKGNWSDFIENRYGTDALGQSNPGKYMKRSNGETADNTTHGHHIVFKEGGSPATKRLAREARDLLRSYGIDPVFGRENLVYAPNQGHPASVMRYVHERLTKVHESVGTRAAIVAELQDLGRRYIDRNIPGWKKKS